jgi:preprotein translocase subunit SecD
VGKIAVVATGQVVSAPTVMEESFGRDAISITGDFTAEQLTAIADALSPA